ncbi:MAG: SAM-dependent methyltransferase, partial [Novosphingobium sp.]
MAAVLAGLLLLLPLAACRQAEDSDRPPTSREFPRAMREVSQIKGNAFSTEVQRDSVNEAATVMDLARIEAGMTVADIGAGEGYYTVRLAERVGRRGRVLAQDID